MTDGDRAGGARRPTEIRLTTISAIVLLAMLPRAASGQTNTVTPPPMSGHPVTIETIRPADVLARVELLRDDLERIRFEMGQPRARPSTFAVTDASPREVMYQAFTLDLKAGQLLFELTGARETATLLDQPLDVKPLHVWNIIDRAYGRTLAAKRILAIAEPSAERTQDTSASPTDVFIAIQQANRQFDQLLKQRLSARDVFHQVQQATHYAARLIGQFPGATVMPVVPAFERGKRPVDVYNRLVESYDLLRRIADRSGRETLHLRVSRLNASVDDPAQVSPSEAYNVAVLVVSELAYLHQALGYETAPPAARAFGFKLPADVYQQAGLLLIQLTDLDARVDNRPQWLENAANR